MPDFYQPPSRPATPPVETSASFPKSSGRMELLSGDSQATHAVVLVGGIHGSYHYLDSWVPALSSSDNLVVGWDHNHQTSTMKEGAHTLAEALNNLKASGITDVTVVAYSMGGLVAKGAIDELSRTGEAEGFQSLDLHALGTPWGGFAAADIIRYLPGTELISNAIGYPMGMEMGPGSDYMSSLTREMPSNGEMHLYTSSADSVATPEVDSTKARYASIEANATSATEIADFKHGDYNKASADLLEASRGGAVPGFDTETLTASLDSPLNNQHAQKPEEVESLSVEKEADGASMGM
jgi:hypothetical protein